MDPYLEAHWLDVHNGLVYLTKAALQPQLGADFVARSEERIIVEDPDGPSRSIGPDVRIVETGSQGDAFVAAAGSATGVAVAEPIVFQLEVEPFPQRSNCLEDHAKWIILLAAVFVSSSALRADSIFSDEPGAVPPTTQPYVHGIVPAAGT